MLADTLDAATDADVAALRQVVEATFLQYSPARRHDFAQAVLVLDLDLSPLPASKHAEGSERGYMGRCRSKTGRRPSLPPSGCWGSRGTMRRRKRAGREQSGA